jgi:hypothetical protein
MAGLHGRAGLLIDPGADASAVAEAYRDLRRRLPELDLSGARNELRARYGREAVAARLQYFHRGALERPEPAPDHGPRVVMRRSRLGTVADLSLRRVPGKVLDRLLAAARRRPGPGLEVVVRHAQRAHRRSVNRILSRPRAASARVPRR